MYENYIDKNLLEDQELDINVGIYLDYFLCEDKTSVATVGPSEVLGPPGSSLLWLITQIKIL